MVKFMVKIRTENTPRITQRNTPSSELHFRYLGIARHGSLNQNLTD